MHRLLILLLLVPHPSRAACTTRLAATLPLTLWHDKVLLPVGINGTQQMIALDTGAAISTISTAVADSIDLPHDFDHHAELGGVGGAESVLYIGQVDTLQLDRIRLDHLALPIVGMAMKTPAGEPVAGLLGAEILRRFDVDIDVPDGRLDLWRAEGCAEEPPPWPSVPDPIAFDLDAEDHILVPLKVEGVTLSGVLDTGAAGLAITTRAAYRAGLSEESLENDIAIHGIGVNDRGWTGHLHRFDNIVFGGVTLHRLLTEVIPSTVVSRYDGLIGADALIGMPILRHMRLWISYHTKTLYVLSASSSAPE